MALGRNVEIVRHTAFSWVERPAVERSLRKERRGVVRKGRRRRGVQRCAMKEDYLHDRTKGVKAYMLSGLAPFAGSLPQLQDMISTLLWKFPFLCALYFETLLVVCGLLTTGLWWVRFIERSKTRSLTKLDGGGMWSATETEYMALLYVAWGSQISIFSQFCRQPSEIWTLYSMLYWFSITHYTCCNYKVLHPWHL